MLRSHGTYIKSFLWSRRFSCPKNPRASQGTKGTLADTRGETTTEWKGRRVLRFSVLRFWLIFRSVFLVLVFIAVCGFSGFFSIWFSVFAKNTNGFLDLISDAVFGFSYLTYLGSGFSSIWAAITRHHWSRIATKRKCYREECNAWQTDLKIS